jgi:hypothetical protein
MIELCQDKEQSRPDDGGQYDAEKEIDYSLKRDPFFPASSDGNEKSQKKADGDKKTISVKIETAQPKENWKHLWS